MSSCIFQAIRCNERRISLFSSGTLPPFAGIRSRRSTSLPPSAWRGNRLEICCRIIWPNTHSSFRDHLPCGLSNIPSSFSITRSVHFVTTSHGNGNRRHRTHKKSSLNRELPTLPYCQLALSSIRSASASSMSRCRWASRLDAAAAMLATKSSRNVLTLPLVLLSSFLMMPILCLSR